MNNYIYALASVIVVSLISFIGLITIALKKETLEKVTVLLVALSTGALMGDAFLHLLPESMERAGGSLLMWFLIMAGILIFFILEKIICWHHCHLPDSETHHHPLGIMSIVGETLHNFLDGVIIGGSFLISVPLGIATTLAIIAHEIPQELTDFGILIYAGFSRARALLYNFLSAMAAIFGTAITLIIGNYTMDFAGYIIPFTAGGFIYIALSDLIPELHKETIPLKSLRQLAIILLGIMIMWGLKMID